MFLLYGIAAVICSMVVNADARGFRSLGSDFGPCMPEALRGSRNVGSVRCPGVAVARYLVALEQRRRAKGSIAARGVRKAER